MFGTFVYARIRLLVDAAKHTYSAQLQQQQDTIIVSMYSVRKHWHRGGGSAPTKLYVYIENRS